MRVITVTTITTASAQTIWRLWAEVDLRKRWDDSLASITIDGPFQAGQTGTVTLKGQPARKYRILELEVERLYTDCFYLPMGGRMVWRHSIETTGDHRLVTFDVSVSGPTSLLLGLIMKQILKKELPQAVDALVRVAEAG